MYPGFYASATPDKPAIIMGQGEVVTYRELDERSNQCARLFAAMGLRAGDTVALFMDNSPTYFYAAWGAQRSGLYYTPISTHLSPDEVRYIVDNCTARVVVVAQGYAGHRAQNTRSVATGKLVDVRWRCGLVQRFRGLRSAAVSSPRHAPRA